MTEHELKTLLSTVTPPDETARAAAHAHWAALAKPQAQLRPLALAAVKSVPLAVESQWWNSCTGRASPAANSILSARAVSVA